MVARTALSLITRIANDFFPRCFFLCIVPFIVLFVFVLYYYWHSELIYNICIFLLYFTKSTNVYVWYKFVLCYNRISKFENAYFNYFLNFFVHFGDKFKRVLG